LGGRMLFLRIGNVLFEPQYSRWITIKLATLGTIVNDIYDAFGTIEKLELFTNAIDIFFKLKSTFTDV